MRRLKTGCFSSCGIVAGVRSAKESLLTSVAASSCGFVERFELPLTLFTDAGIDLRVSPLRFSVFFMPRDSCRRFMPSTRGGDAVLYDVPARYCAPTRLPHVIAHVLSSMLKLKIGETIVERIAVFVMNVHTARDRPVSIDPHVAVERMRCLFPFVMAPVIDAVSSLLCVRIAPIDFVSVHDRE
jgi:hypothetical protein